MEKAEKTGHVQLDGKGALMVRVGEEAAILELAAKYAARHGQRKKAKRSAAGRAGEN